MRDYIGYSNGEWIPDSQFLDPKAKHHSRLNMVMIPSLEG